MQQKIKSFLEQPLNKTQISISIASFLFSVLTVLSVGIFDIKGEVVVATTQNVTPAQEGALVSSIFKETSTDTNAKERRPLKKVEKTTPLAFSGSSLQCIYVNGYYLNTYDNGQTLFDMRGYPVFFDSNSRAVTWGDDSLIEQCSGSATSTPNFYVNTSIQGTGSGAILGVNSSYSRGENVQLTARPDEGSVFGGWSGDNCTGTDTNCSFSINNDVSVTAIFTYQEDTDPGTSTEKYSLTVTKPSTNTGVGMVNTSDSKISCGDDCTEEYDKGTTVILTAIPTAIDSVFTNWSGACSGTEPTCTVTMDYDQQVTAVFSKTSDDYLQLYTSTNGTGVGTIDGAKQTYTNGEVARLTATPGTSSNFNGWTGECSGKGECVLVMKSNKSVAATFTLKDEYENPYVLTVTKTGEGSGKVTGTSNNSTEQIDCGEECSKSYKNNQQVNLTATPDEGSIFKGWSGACTHETNFCIVNMYGDQQVTAEFEKKGFVLTIISDDKVTVTGASDGQTFKSGDKATLNVTFDSTKYYLVTTIGTENTNSKESPATTEIVMDSDKTVKYEVKDLPKLKVTTDQGEGTGTVTADPERLGKEVKTIDTTYSGYLTLTAKADKLSKFSYWKTSLSDKNTDNPLTIDIPYDFENQYGNEYKIDAIFEKEKKLPVTATCSGKIADKTNDINWSLTISSSKGIKPSSFSYLWQDRSTLKTNTTKIPDGRKIFDNQFSNSVVVSYPDYDDLTVQCQLNICPALPSKVRSKMMELKQGAFTDDSESGEIYTCSKKGVLKEYDMYASAEGTVSMPQSDLDEILATGKKKTLFSIVFLHNHPLPLVKALNAAGKSNVNINGSGFPPSVMDLASASRFNKDVAKTYSYALDGENHIWDYAIPKDTCLASLFTSFLRDPSNPRNIRGCLKSTDDSFGNYVQGLGTVEEYLNTARDGGADIDKVSMP